MPRHSGDEARDSFQGEAQYLWWSRLVGQLGSEVKVYSLG